MSKADRVFTKEYPNKNYKPTLDSKQSQCKYWPEYLPVDETRLLIFERSKNAQLVVYSLNFKGETNASSSELRELDPSWPIDINWQSFGWTKAPTSNPTHAMERKLAWGYSHEPVTHPQEEQQEGEAKEKLPNSYKVSLNALPKRKALLYFCTRIKDWVLQTEVNGKKARLRKVFVQATSNLVGLPKVHYVELYGSDINTDEDVYEKYIP